MKHAIEILKIEREMLDSDPLSREAIEDLDLAIALLETPIHVPETFEGEIATAINHHSKESGSNTPDFILAEYLRRCLENFDATMSARTAWYAPQPA